jgi:hypothetical protein
MFLKVLLLFLWDVLKGLVIFALKISILIGILVGSTWCIGSLMNYIWNFNIPSHELGVICISASCLIIVTSHFAHSFLSEKWEEAKIKYLTGKNKK